MAYTEPPKTWISGRAPSFIMGEWPSQGIVCCRGQFVMVKHRAGEITDYSIGTVMQLIDLCARQNSLLPAHYRLMLRGVFVDDKRGGFKAWLDLVYDQRSELKSFIDLLPPEFQAKELSLGGNPVFLELNGVEVDMQSDSYFPISDQFYVAPRGMLGWKPQAL